MNTQKLAPPDLWQDGWQVGGEEEYPSSSLVDKNDIHKCAVLPQTKFSLLARNFQIKIVLRDEITQKMFDSYLLF